MSQDSIVIVGAGIVGLSTAYALLQRGVKNVTVFEQAAVDHQRATSRGISRLLRFEYGTASLYSEMVKWSLERWQQLEEAVQRHLYTPTGVLVLGREDDTYIRESFRTLSKLGIATEHLSRAEVEQRYPQFNSSSYDLFTYNENAGMLHASACLHALKERILALGGTLFEQQAVERISYENPRRPLLIHLQAGKTLSADNVVLATGPWVHRLLADLHLPVKTTRQYLLYFANLHTTSFGRPAFPAFIADDLYGFPLHNTCVKNGPCWLKAASHSFGPLIDPDEPQQATEERVIAQVQQQLYDLIPALRQAALVQVDHCMYDVSLDGDFILDRHPADERIVFATGLSGHGFKFGPILGEILGSLVQGTPAPVPLERFSMARFSKLYSSSVA